MAPNVTIHFWDANDINNATPILEITDEDEFFRGFKLTPDLYSLGGWELTLARRVGFALFDSGAVQPEVFVRFLVHAWSDFEYLWGGVLQKRNQVVVARDEQGEEVFTFGGPGPKAYMDRYRLGIEQLTGTGWNLDLGNGVWRWTETATAGRVLNRVVAEDAAADDPSLPDLTKTFTDSDDSNSDAWTNDVAGANEYEIPIGQSLLETIYDLEDLADLYTSIGLGNTGAPAYILDAWQSYGYDVTGSDPAAGVCILREGLNIANDSLTVEGVGIRKCTHVIVEGKDGSWATAVRPTWSSGDYIKWGKIEYVRSSNENILEKAGLRWLRRQDNGDKQITVEIVPGADEDAGLYFPAIGGTLWLGNTITLDTAEDGTTHTPLDFNNEDELLTGLDLTLGPAGDTATADKKAKSWDIKVRLNWERAGFAGAPDQTSAATGKSCSCGGKVQHFIPCDGGTCSETFQRSVDDGGGTSELLSLAWTESGDAGPTAYVTPGQMVIPPPTSSVTPGVTTEHDLELDFTALTLPVETLELVRLHIPPGGVQGTDSGPRLDIDCAIRSNTGTSSWRWNFSSGLFADMLGDAVEINVSFDRPGETTATTDAFIPDGVLQQDRLLYVRRLCAATNFKLKAWWHGNSEPADWLIDFTPGVGTAASPRKLRYRNRARGTTKSGGTLTVMSICMVQGASCSDGTCASCVPASGDFTRPVLVAYGDGTSMEWTVPSAGYRAGSLWVFVDGILQLATESDPDAGAFTLDFAPTAEEQVLAAWRSA